MLSIFGYAQLFATRRRLFWLCYVVPLVQVLAIAGYHDHIAGHMVGPRYLAPLIPLLLLPAAIGTNRWPAVGILLGLVSVVFITSATVVDAQLPSNHQFPVFTFYWPALVHGRLSHNIGRLMGLSGMYSLLPLVIVTFCGILYCFIAGAQNDSAGTSRSKRLAGPNEVPTGCSGKAALP